MLLGVDVKPSSGIERWGDWPNDVRPLLEHWNKSVWVGLSFYRRGLFDCDDCHARCEPSKDGVATFGATTFGSRQWHKQREWLCDDCLIARARAVLPIWQHYRESGRRDFGCICPTPARRSDGSYDWRIDPNCRYHKLAAQFPDDHSIPWNCPTYYDGCNCTRPKR